MLLRFWYRARDGRGVLQKGYLEAKGLCAAAEQLRKRSLHIIQLKQATGLGLFNIGEVEKALQGKVGSRELAVFTRQFATVLAAGVPVLQCLDILASQAESRKLKVTIKEVITSLEGGRTLAEAFRLHSDIFPKIFFSMVEVGEAGGVLDQAIARLALHFEKEHEIKEKIKSSLMYPGAVVCVALMATIFLLTFVLPRFTDLLGYTGAELPLPTRVLIGISHFLQRGWLWLLGSAIIFFLTFKAYAGTAKGGLALDLLKLKLPIYGLLLKKIHVSQFCRILSTLLMAGITITAALDVVRNASENKAVTKMLSSVQSSVQQGLGIAEPLERGGIFPAMVGRMIALGEKTGTTDTMLEKIASIYEREVDESASRLSSMLEPVLIVFMGLLIGFIVLSILMPVFQVLGSGLNY